MRANIEEILHNGQRVHGVSVRKGSTNLKYKLEAPVTVSTAGMYNTFYKLLSKDVASKSSLYPWANRIGPSSGAIYAFIGLNASSKELCLPRQAGPPLMMRFAKLAPNTEFRETMGPRLRDRVPGRKGKFAQLKGPFLCGTLY